MDPSDYDEGTPCANCRRNANNHRTGSCPHRRCRLPSPVRHTKACDKDHRSTLQEEKIWDPGIFEESLCSTSLPEDPGNLCRTKTEEKNNPDDSSGVYSLTSNSNSAASRPTTPPTGFVAAVQDDFSSATRRTRTNYPILKQGEKVGDKEANEGRRLQRCWDITQYDSDITNMIFKQTYVQGSLKVQNKALASQKLVKKHIKSSVIYQTRLIKDAADRLIRKRPHVIVITGKDSQGKTSAGKEILAIFSNNQKMKECFGRKSIQVRQPLIIHSPDLWDECVGFKESLAVLIDDLDCKTWQRYFDDIYTAADENVYIVLTIKECVFEDNRRLLSRWHNLFNRDNVFDLCSEVYLLDAHEKEEILGKRIQAHGLNVNDEFCASISNHTPSFLFLEYVSIFFSNPEKYLFQKTFFNRPLVVLRQMLHNLKISSLGRYKEKYAFLCTLYLNKGVIDFNISAATKDIDIELRKRLDVETKPPLAYLRKLANLLRNTFVKFENEVCLFSSPSVRMAVQIMLLEDFPDRLSEIADYDLIDSCFRPLNNVRDERDVSGERFGFLIFDVKPTLYQPVSRILELEMLQGNVSRVLRHPLFKEQDFVNEFFSQCGLKTLLTEDKESGNSALFHAVKVPTAYVVERVLFNEHWEAIVRRIALKQTNYVPLSSTENFVREQSCITLSEACQFGKLRDIKALMKARTPVTLKCLVNVSRSGRIEILQHVCHATTDLWTTEQLSEALFESCKAYSDPNRRHSWDNADVPAVISYLLQIGGRPNMQLPEVGLPIIYAVEHRDNALVKLLLKIGVDIHYRDSRAERTLLHILTNNAFDSEVAATLISAGIDVDARDLQGQTSLHLAVIKQESETVSFLLNHNADINKGDSHRCTPLIIASNNGYLAIVELLISRGAQPDLKDDKNESALLKAIRKRHQHILEFFSNRSLVTKECLFHLVCEGDTELMEILCKPPLNKLDISDDDWSRFLEVAVRNSLSDMTSFLLKHGAEPDGFVGKECKYKLTFYSIMKGDLKIFDILCKAGSDLALVDKNGNSALHVCCAVDAVDFVDYILKTRDDLLFARNNSNWTPLECSSYFGRYSTVVKLYQYAESQFQHRKLEVCSKLYDRSKEGYVFKYKDKSVEFFDGEEPVKLASRSEYKQLFAYLKQKAVHFGISRSPNALPQ